MRSILLSTLGRIVVFGVGTLVCAVGANAEGDKVAYENAKASAKSTYEVAGKQCDAMKGNAKDICVAEAKAARIKTEEEAEAAYEGTPKARSRATSAIAEANYKVARARCDERTGNDKDVCIKEAKATRDKTKADAKAHLKSTTAMADARDTKMEAEYKVAKEKCDSMSGDAKDQCIKQAKAKYGQ